MDKLEMTKLALEYVSDCIYAQLERERTGNIISPSKIANRIKEDTGEEPDKDTVEGVRAVAEELSDFLADKASEPMAEDVQSAILYPHRNGEDKVRKVRVTRTHESYTDVINIVPEGTTAIQLTPKTKGKWELEFYVSSGQLQRHTLGG